MTLIAFIVLDWMGVTLNMVVLFSLTLALGMLVDNAIVIIENIYRFAEQGVPREEAAVAATGEVGVAILGSALVTIAGFVPLLVWPGIMGEFMVYLPLTVIVTLTSCLFVAILTGIIGRSIYTLTPKPDRARLAQHLAVLDHIGPGMGQTLSQRLGLVPRTRGPERSSLLGWALALPGYKRELDERRRVFDRTVHEYAQFFGHELGLVRRRIADCRSIYVCEVRAAVADTLLRSWRGVHRLSALLMVLLVVMHIVIAWYYGFVWAASH